MRVASLLFNVHPLISIVQRYDFVHSNKTKCKLKNLYHTVAVRWCYLAFALIIIILLCSSKDVGIFVISAFHVTCIRMNFLWNNMLAMFNGTVWVAVFYLLILCNSDSFYDKMIYQEIHPSEVATKSITRWKKDCTWFLLIWRRCMMKYLQKYFGGLC